MSIDYHGPENALRRANDFIDVGERNRALEILFDVIKKGKRRPKYSEELLEPIMFKYLELCVDMQNCIFAKEALYNYRNMFPSVNISSLETVIKFYLKLANERTESAWIASLQFVVENDLDNFVTSEEILISAVSRENAQDRSDRMILTPWVKFLWGSYSKCLELLRTNSRVEKLYHSIAQHSFKFCEKYNRKTEFRKLCDHLQTHLTHIQKQQGSAIAVNLNNPETQRLNIETRLEQINYAIKMGLWQEAFKAIKVISDLMEKSKKMPKPHVMASYYEKLALLFWKVGNHLFHAAALFKLFKLLKHQNNNITNISKIASVVLVATLSIPLPSGHPEICWFLIPKNSALKKTNELANFLSLSKPPTRESLIKDLIPLNVVNSVPLELRNMYQLMEVKFDPLHLCSRMQVHLNWIKNKVDSDLPQYVLALQKMTITHMVMQVAQVYQTVTFKRLLELSVFMSRFHLERMLVDLVRHNDLQIRIDHRTNCVHFGIDLRQSQREDLPKGPTLQTLPSETIRCQLVHINSSLQKCLTLIAPEKKKMAMEPIRAQTAKLYYETHIQERERILQRPKNIDERKELLKNKKLEREEPIQNNQGEQEEEEEANKSERIVKKKNSSKTTSPQAEQLKRPTDKKQETLRKETNKREKSSSRTKPPQEEKFKPQSEGEQDRLRKEASRKEKSVKKKNSSKEEKERFWREVNNIERNVTRISPGIDTFPQEQLKWQRKEEKERLLWEANKRDRNVMMNPRMCISPQEEQMKWQSREEQERLQWEVNKRDRNINMNPSIHTPPQLEQLKWQRKEDQERILWEANQRERNNRMNPRMYTLQQEQLKCQRKEDQERLLWEANQRERNNRINPSMYTPQHEQLKYQRKEDQERLLWEANQRERNNRINPSMYTPQHEQLKCQRKEDQERLLWEANQRERNNRINPSMYTPQHEQLKCQRKEDQERLLWEANKREMKIRMNPNIYTSHQQEQIKWQRKEDQERLCWESNKRERNIKVNPSIYTLPQEEHLKCQKN